MQVRLEAHVPNAQIRACVFARVVQIHVVRISIYLRILEFRMLHVHTRASVSNAFS